MKTQTLYKRLSMPLLLTVISVAGIGVTPARSASLVGLQSKVIDANPKEILIAKPECRPQPNCQPGQMDAPNSEERPSENPSRDPRYQREIEQQREQQQRKLEQQQRKLEQQQRKLEQQQRELEQQPTVEPPPQNQQQ